MYQSISKWTGFRKISYLEYLPRTVDTLIFWAKLDKSETLYMNTCTHL